MNRLTGKRIEGAAHIAQSIRDILTTRLGTRVERRDYGSELLDLIDTPINPATPALLRAATAGAIGKWEPRVRVRKVSVTDPAATGSLTISIEAVRTDLPQTPALSLAVTL